MKPLSERLKTFSASQFIDWLCLACVDVREVRTAEDAQDVINEIREAVIERLFTLEDKLRIKQNHITLRDTYIEELEQRAEAAEACTNSLTNAQEALKSTGIEADTVQAGVMELVSKLAELHQIRNERDAAIQGAERKERELSRTYQQLSAMQADTERMNYLAGKVVNVRTPLPYGSHNIFWSQCITDDSDPSYETDLREQIDAQLRAGNAGKDGV